MSFIRIAILTLCLFFMLTTLPFALVWLIRKLVGAMKDVRHLPVRVIPLFATLAFLIVPSALTQLDGAQIGSLNLWTSGIFLGTLLFRCCRSWAWCLYCSCKAGDHRGVRIHSLLVSSACCVVAGSSCLGISWPCASGRELAFTRQRSEAQERIESRKTLAASRGKDARVAAAGANLRRTIHARIFFQSSGEVGQPSRFVHSPFCVEYQ